MNIEIHADGQKLSFPTIPYVVSDAIGYHRFIVYFDGTWNTQVRYLLLTAPNGTTYTLPLEKSSEYYQSQYVQLVSGTYRMSVFGETVSGDAIALRETTGIVSLAVTQSGLVSGEPFPEIEGSVGEAVLLSEDARSEAETARALAESARVGAESNRASSELLRAAAEALRVSAESDRSDFYAGFNSRLADVANYPRLWRKTAALSVAQITPVPSSPLDATVKTVAVQAGSGDPSPSNIRAITGRSSAVITRASKNIVDWATVLAGLGAVSGITKTVSGNMLTLSGIPSSTWRQLQYVMAVPSGWIGKTVVCKCTSSGNQPYASVHFKNASGVLASASFGSSLPIIVPSDTTIVNFVFCLNQGTVDAGATYTATYTNMQLEFGSVPTAYEAFVARDTLTLTPASTLYGIAGAEDEIGVDGRETHNTALKTFGGTETTQNTGTAPDASYACVSVPAAQTPNCAQKAKLLCNTFPVGTFAAGIATECVWGNPNSPNFGFVIALSRLAAYGATSDRATHPAAVTAWLAAQNSAGTPVQVLYQLATPTTAQGTAQTLAALAQADKYTPRLNNVYSDGGNVVVGHAKSPIKESDELRAAITTLGGTL